MNKGYFDESSKDWIVQIRDKRGKPLDLGKGKIHKARDKSDPTKTQSFKITRLVWGQQTHYPENVNLIAEIDWGDGEVNCWLCYYIFDRYERWAFGQFGPMMPNADLKELYEYAHEKGIL